MSKYNSIEYQKNKEQYKARNKKYLSKSETKLKRAKKQREYRKNKGKNIYKQTKITRKTKLLEQYKDFMSDKTCLHCGYSDTRSLVWHHVDPSNKKNGVIQLIGRLHSWNTIIEEINKCICLCHNCHNILHNHQSPPSP
jgi:hypothetical protein